MPPRRKLQATSYKLQAPLQNGVVGLRLEMRRLFPPPTTHHPPNACSRSPGEPLLLFPSFPFLALSCHQHTPALSLRIILHQHYQEADAFPARLSFCTLLWAKGTVVHPCSRTLELARSVCGDQLLPLRISCCRSGQSGHRSDWPSHQHLILSIISSATAPRVDPACRALGSWASRPP